jgi:hypothetical protein
MIDALLSQLETDLGTFVTAFVTTARAHLENGVALVAEERTRGLTEVAEERAEMALKRAELSQEIEVMQMHREMQQGRIGVNIGGYRFETTVQTLRRVPNTFFDAYFSGRYAQDVCNDGSIFVDRDGEHFGHILEYMRYQDGGGTLSTMERLQHFRMERSGCNGHSPIRFWCLRGRREHLRKWWARWPRELCKR